MEEILEAIKEAANTIATPNWADIVGVCFSLLAIVVAGFVAWRQNEISRKQTAIADKQNKINLFEMRFEIYEILIFCAACARLIESTNKKEDVVEYFFISFTKDPRELREFNFSKAVLYVTKYSIKLKNATLFFSEEIASYIANVSNALSSLVNTDAKVDGTEKFNEIKQRYFETIKALEENEVFERIRAEMKTI